MNRRVIHEKHGDWTMEIEQESENLFMGRFFYDRQTFILCDPGFGIKHILCIGNN